MPAAVRISIAFYRLLVRLWPAGLRSRFGEAMEATFRDAAIDAHARAGVLGLFRLWIGVLLDAARSAPREHVAEWLEARRADGGGGIVGVVRKRRVGFMDLLQQDLRWAWRSLIRRPAFTLIAVVTLGLGVGANSALYSVVRTVLLAPLPYTDPDGVVMIWSRWRGFDKTWVSVSEYHNYRAQLRSFRDLALFQTFEANLTEGDEPERATVSIITPNLLDVVGVQPVLGRGFREEEATGQAATVVVLSYELWQRRYRGDPTVLGRSLSVNGEAHEIIGVLPEGFRLPLDFRTDRPTAAWFPFAIEPPGAFPSGGGSHGSYLIGRLNDGVSAEAANAELGTLVAGLRADGTYPVDWNFEAFVVTAADEVAGMMRPALLVLLGAVGLVLLIACVNVANLLLVRGEDRRQEVGVRAALGAGGRRLLRQLTVENALLAACGGVLGAGVAWAAVLALRATAPADLPRVAETTIDAGVLAFTAAVSLLTAVLFGMAPALHVLRSDVQSLLREGGRANTASGSRTRLRRGLVTLEVAMAVLLAIGSGIMLRSFWKLVSLDPGFAADHVLTMRLSPPAAYYPDDAAVTGFYHSLLDQVRALPGVAHAGLIRVLPIDQPIGDACVDVEGYTPPPDECAPSDWQAASPGYFEALGLRLVEGRFIEDGDTRDAAQIIVVNEAFVRRYIPNGNALGRRVTFAFTDSTPPQTIVGVVGDARHNGITGEIKPTFYRPHAQWARSTGFPQRGMALVVRSAGPAPLSLAPAVRDVVRRLDPRLPVSNIQTMETVLSRAVAQPRFTLVLLLAFGGLALALAVVGIHGVVAYTVAARRQELGIRMALGATPRAVVWLATRHGLIHAAAGVALGTGTGLVASRLLRGLVYETPTVDFATYAAVAVLGLVASFVACWIPARRAAGADPLTALRTE